MAERTINIKELNLNIIPPTAETMFNPNQGGAKIVVIGKPGTGKTTLIASLLYENTQRLAGLPSDYYSLVEPWYKAPSVPFLTGYHMYSYSANVYDINPMGSTNYGKLTNVTLDLTPFDTTKLSAGEKLAIAGNVFESVIVAVNHNVIRISGGALGFPVL